MGWLLTTLCLAQAPDSNPPDPGQIRVVVTHLEDDSWLRAVWRRSVRKLQRRWRREVRRSDEEIPPPDLPDPPGDRVADAAVTVEGESLVGGVVQRWTDADGEVNFTLPPGTYRVIAEHHDAMSQIVDPVQITAGQTLVIPIALEAYPQEFLITWLMPTSRP